MLRPKAHVTAFMRQQHLKRYCEAAPSLVASATQRIAVQKNHLIAEFCGLCIITERW